MNSAGLRTKEDQEILAALSACKNIHTVASIDHVNSMLMWDMRLLSLWRWSMHDITSFETYVDEVADLPFLIAGEMSFLWDIVYWQIHLSVRCDI